MGVILIPEDLEGVNQEFVQDLAYASGCSVLVAPRELLEQIKYTPHEDDPLIRDYLEGI